MMIEMTTISRLFDKMSILANVHHQEQNENIQQICILISSNYFHKPRSGNDFVLQYRNDFFQSI